MSNRISVLFIRDFIWRQLSLHGSRRVFLIHQSYRQAYIKNHLMTLMHLLCFIF